MGWETVETNYTSAVDIKNDPSKTYEGTYISNRTFDSQFGEQVVWEFQKEDGEKFGIFGFTTLNKAMEHLKVGAKVKIRYKGKTKTKTKFGVRDVHQVDVSVWSDDAPIAATEIDSFPEAKGEA